MRSVQDYPKVETHTSNNQAVIGSVKKTATSLVGPGGYCHELSTAVMCWTSSKSDIIKKDIKYSALLLLQSRIVSSRLFIFFPVTSGVMLIVVVNLKL